MVKTEKVKVYSLISSISSDFYIFNPWSLNLFLCVPSQLHGEHTVLQPIRRIELIIHIAISVLPGTHFHLRQVKHLRVKCLAQGHNIKQCPNIERGKHDISLKILHQVGFETAQEAAALTKLRNLTVASYPSLENTPEILQKLQSPQKLRGFALQNEYMLHHVHMRQATLESIR